MSRVILGLTNSGILIGISRHCAEIQFIDELTDEAIESGHPVLVDNSVIQVPDGVPQFNTSPLSRLLALHPESLKEFEDSFGMTGAKASLTIFTMMNDSGHLPLVAIGYSERLMHGDVGPRLGFSHGAAFMCDDVTVLPSEVLEVLSFCVGKYAGEIAIDIDENWNISRVRFGHQPQYVSMFSEFYGMQYGSLLSWMVRGEDLPRCTAGLVVSALVSKSPFPYVSIPTGDIQADVQAEKHIWRFPIGNAQVALVSAHAEDTSRSRRRVFRTINRMRKYDETLQYRTDIAYRLNFGKLQDVYTNYCKDSSRSA